MDMASYEDYKEVRQKIKAHLAKKSDWLSEHWFEAHEDLIRDQLAEELSFEPDDAVNRLVPELDDAHRKLFHYLSGKEIVDLLRSKMSDKQIVDVLINIGDAYETKPTQHLIIFSLRNCPWEEEIFVDEDDDLAGLVALLPDDSMMKKDMLLVNIDVGPFYFCVRADTFLEEIQDVINTALADGYIKELLEASSNA